MPTEKQEVIYRWLKDERNYPVYAEVYKSATELIEHSHTGYITLVAHVGRDLMNGLSRNSCDKPVNRVQYEQYVNAIAKMWKSEWGCDTDLSAKDTIEAHEIPHNICKKISILISEHKKGCERNIEAPYSFFQNYFGIADREKIKKSYLDSWKNLKVFFLKYAHIREKQYDARCAEDVKQNFLQLEDYLYHAASSQKRRLEDLNAILDATNA